MARLDGGNAGCQHHGGGDAGRKPPTDIRPADRAWLFATCRDVARRVCRYEPTLREDAESAALVRAWSAYAQTPAREYVRRAAHNGAADFLRKSQGYKGGRYGHKAFLSSGTAPLTVTDPVSRRAYDNPRLPAAPGADAALLAEAGLKAILDLLPRRAGGGRDDARELLARYYSAPGVTIEEAGRELGMGRKSAHNLHQRALRRLRERVPDPSRAHDRIEEATL